MPLANPKLCLAYLRYGTSGFAVSVYLSALTWALNFNYFHWDSKTQVNIQLCTLTNDPSEHNTIMYCHVFSNNCSENQGICRSGDLICYTREMVPGIQAAFSLPVKTSVTSSSTTQYSYVHTMSFYFFFLIREIVKQKTCLNEKFNNLYALKYEYMNFC